MCFVMDAVRFIILFLMTKTFANGIIFSPSSEKATVGVDFTFTCVTKARLISFNKNGVPECSTGGYPNGTCKFAGEYNRDFKYDCNISTGVYNLTIPSSFDIDTLHGTNWTCVAPLDVVTSESIQLYVYVPIMQVTITAIPTDSNPTTIVLDTNQNFNCITNAGRPSSRIQWYISGDNITGSASPQTEVCNSMCTGKVVTSSALMYTGNKSDDGKIIYCTAVNVIGQSVRSENRSINIWYGPSSVTIYPQTQMYTVNEYTGIVGPVTCKANGCKPGCVVKWSGPNFTGDASSTLRLASIDRNKAGNYFCTASNGAWSETSVNISIIVHYSPSKVNISPLTQNYTVQEITGRVGPIYCTADCKPACIMTWNGPNIADGTTSVLNLQNINRNQAGEYRCNATNIIGSEISVIVNIIVNYGPGQVYIAPNISIYTVTEKTGHVGPITCTADCNPSCSMTWTGQNSHGGALSELNLQEIDRNQAGSYQCNASNSIGNNLSSTISVIVNYGPNHVNISPLKQNYTAIETIGKVGPINCTADCKPACTMTWNGPNLLEGITSVLHLLNISKLQAGYYSCNASNSVSSLTSVAVNVIVNYGPAVVNISSQTQHHIVNETNSVTNISCTADCNPSCTMTWSGPNFPAKLPGSDTSMLNIHNIARNQSGSYQCNASNTVSSQISISINITVNFRPAVKDIFGNRSFHENDTVPFSCYVESVPTAEIKWFFNDKFHKKTYMFFGHDIMKPKNKYQISTLNISKIGCLSMGTYSCAAHNIIGDDKKEIDIDISCSPRINAIEYNVTKLIAVKDQEPLNLTAPIIAYPKPYIFWTFFNNETFVNVTEKMSNIVINNRVFSSLYLENITETDFGHYRIYAGNGIGSSENYIYAFEVIPKRKPNPPDNVTCIGRPKSVLVNWKSNFNGGDTQSFQIFFKKDDSANFYEYGHKYQDPGRNLYLTATITQLTPETTYQFRVHAVNEHNITKSELTTCNTTSGVDIGQKQADIVAIGAGTGIGGAVVLVIIAGIFIFIHRRKIKEKIDQDKEPMQRSVDSEEDNEADGLKENPLYASSPQEPEGTVYSVVNKKTQNINKEKGKPSDENTIYTEVVKSKKKDKKNKEIEMGYVYQNSENISQRQTEDVYANSEMKGNFGDKQVYTPTKNKDGLIYADLDLMPTMNGNRFVIRGLENRNNYAVIDLTKTAEPLPSESDSDDDKAKTTTEKE